MWVNNEVGVVQPVAEIAGRCRAGGRRASTPTRSRRSARCPWTCDGFPAPSLTISGHKIGAPKGIGALIVRDRQAVEAIIHGGGQQFGIRPGTENVAGAVALGRAAALAAEEQPQEAERLRALRDDLAGRLTAAVPDLVVNAERADRAPHVLNVAVPGADSEALLMHLDLAGVAASSGSACSTGAVEPSHVLMAMGVPRELALGAIRFSLGHEQHGRGRGPGGGGHAGGGGEGPEAGRSAGPCRERVLVAMSGGVDSSVAAARLVEQGYDVVGATMKLFCYGDEVPDRPCCSLDSINDARDVAHTPRHPALRAQSRGPLRPARHRELRERVQPRADADSVRALQLVHQVPRPAGPRRRARLRGYLATGHYAVARDGGAVPRRRSGQGPELLPLGHRPRRRGADADAGRGRSPRRRPAPMPGAWGW